MSPETRLSIFDMLIGNYIQPGDIRTIEQLPALLVAFLAHCSPAAVQKHLLFWPAEGPPLQAAAGVLYGLPNSPR